MEIYKNGLTIFVLLLTLIVLEKWNITEVSSPDLPLHYEDSVPHTRDKRNEPTREWRYIIDVEVNISNVETFERIRSALNIITLPRQLDSNTTLSNFSIITVCSPTATGFQCRCEDQFAWPYSSCATYGACDDISNGICKCINAIPADGQSCQPISELLTQAEYTVDVELNVTDIGTLEYLRSILRNYSISLALSPTVNVTDINITTVCFQNGISFQCRCEDQYIWPLDDCMTYGPCDAVVNDTCGCITGIPSDGRYCQPKKVSPVVYEYQITIEVTTADADQLRNILKNIALPTPISTQINISEVDITTVCSQDGTAFQCRCEDDYLWPCDKCATYGKCEGDTNNTCGCIKAIPTDGQYCQSTHSQNFSACPLTTASPSTAPPVLNQYRISVEVNISDVAVIDRLRASLNSLIYPISINDHIRLADVNISTVCYPNSSSFQCRCEDQYRWSCDQCLTYGPCDNITGYTCGCINAIPPDGQSCQLIDHHNFVVCPVTTILPTTPPVLNQYRISVEVNISDVAAIDRLRASLNSLIYPISINDHIRLADVNISTVCYPNSSSFQCRCENQYRWSCDQCLTYGPCDNMTGYTCGCINAIPPDGQSCQLIDRHNFTVCPVTPFPTTPPVLNQYRISVEVNISNVAAIDRLRASLNSLIYPISINDHIRLADVNISTVCYPNSTSFQCRCEDQYRWSCDQCLTYGPCDTITGDTCGCINAIPPDRQYCQPVDLHNFTVCPVTTPLPSSTTPPVLNQYRISVEVNISDVAAIDRLRASLNSLIYPININDHIQLADVNISTVCYPNSTSVQCRCEDQYRWSCDQCLTYGPCDNITGYTCGCINAIPPDGQSCQLIDHHNFTVCPVTTILPTTPPVLYEYLISVEVNFIDVVVIDQLRAIQTNITHPISIGDRVQLSEVNISTVCYPNSTSFQCRCEDQYRWSCDQCLTYGPCDTITGDTCGCINAIPPDRQYCQPIDLHNFTVCPVTTPLPSSTTPPVLNQYRISVEVNISDVAAIDRLRASLNSLIYPIKINDHIQLADVNISTVCYPNRTSFQCRCENQYRWSCDQCLTYGPCDNITGYTCGCINAIPPDGQSCQLIDHHNFTVCPVTTILPTTPPVLYEYLISVEVNFIDVVVIDQLRAIQTNITHPISIGDRVQLSEVNISTVCYPNSTSFQCRCEDQYRWSCDQCLTYGPCDTITGDTCGCINAIPPDRQYCQPIDLHNFTVCPVTTPLPSSTTPPVLNQYRISVEVNISDVAAIDRLRASLNSLIYPIKINDHIQLADVNISTVCYLNSTSVQCRCEDQYRWSCDQCLTYGPCDNITGDTCGCINAIPPDGQYCQSVYQHSFIACPLTTSLPSPTSMNTTVFTTSTTIVTNSTSIATTNVNTTTATMPPTNSTPIATTYMNTTTATMSPTSLNTTIVTTSPTTLVTNSTTIATTNVNTTTATMPPTNSTPTTHANTTTATMSSTIPTTTITTTASTIVTDATSIATTASSPPTITTESTTISTTATNTTTLPTTHVTSQKSTVSSTISTGAPTTALTTPAETTTTSTAIPTAATSSTITSTGATSTSSTSRAPIFTSALPPTARPGFDVEMSVTLDKTYTAELNDATSSAYKELESDINSVLQDQYETITGFINVFVRGFREGSVIVDFTVRTARVIPDEIAEANSNLPDAMSVIALVNGSVKASYKSSTSISFPKLTYTGGAMTLTCSPPPNFEVGQISGSEWKFNGQEIKGSVRTQITTSGMKSELQVNSVILADIGLYECTLRGGTIHFIQNGRITSNEIKQAPTIRLRSKINVKCQAGQTQELKCCVQSAYKVRWFQDATALSSAGTDETESYCITHNYLIESCSGSQQEELFFTCKVEEPQGYEMTTAMTIFREGIVCESELYGSGRVEDVSRIGCDEGQEGNRTAICQATRKWKLTEDTCIIIEIKELLINSVDLSIGEVPQFVDELNATAQKEKTGISSSPLTISAIVDILNNVANISTAVNETIMEDILETVDVIISDDSRESWVVLNANETGNSSSKLLGSLETLSNDLVGKFAFATQRIIINRTAFTESFYADLNSSVSINISDTNLENVFITTISLSTLNNVMPARNSSFNTSLFDDPDNETVTDSAINAVVLLVNLNAAIQNVTLSYDKLNNSLSLNPQCVFWNFTLLDELGAWDDEGCTFVSDINNRVTCNCSHLTSFSILMATDVPPQVKVALDVITYVGVGISLASLVICLIIEGYVWKAVTRNSTAFMRHISIVNTALSLLIADICFIIAASIAKNPLENPGEDYEVPVGPCSAATFFMHFFYLALFFWMLVSGLLLFYRTVLVFSQMSKSTMLAIGFSLGYGCPLIIAVTTVAATAPGNGYVRRYDACWLNWIETKALLALVIPALTIVFINILILIVVLFKMLRRGVGDTAQADEKHTLAVIARCVIILTPLFGLTWSLGVGTMISSTNEGLHIAFAFFNSLQGLFILVFGTLLDSKIRSILSRKSATSSTGSNPTRSTSGGISSLSGLNWINRLRGRRYVYRLSEAANSSSTGASESFSNI